MKAKLAGWIQTTQNKAFWPQDPSSEEMCVEEIALVLSRTSRFSGHYKPEVEFFSVAEHSCLCYDILHERFINSDREIKLAVLFHDANEVYSGFGDVCSPSKQFCPKIGAIEAGIDISVARLLRIEPIVFSLAQVKECDLVALATEKDHVMGDEPAPWIPLPHATKPKWKLGMLPREAEAKFLQYYKSIVQGD